MHVARQSGVVEHLTNSSSLLSGLFNESIASLAHFLLHREIRNELHSLMGASKDPATTSATEPRKVRNELIRVVKDQGCSHVFEEIPSNFPKGSHGWDRHPEQCMVSNHAMPL